MKLNNISFESKITDIITNAETYHKTYYRNMIFDGPSLHFHLRALNTSKLILNSNENYEMLYAVLVSWGMHRMGTTGAKMQTFQTFLNSLEFLNKEIEVASHFDRNNLSVENWLVIMKIFKGIDVMSSETRLVAHSKVMAHLLPEIVAPIDRSYTLKYLFGNTNIKNDVVSEWNTFKLIMNEFFYPIAEDSDFKTMASDWVNDNALEWDTSVLKVIDNLVIGCVQKKSK